MLAGEAKDARQLTFVGRSGQLYLPRKDGWQRERVGGIASDVIGIVRSGGDIFAIPVRDPLFRLTADGWRAAPLGNEGTISFSADGAATIASIGRHLYKLDKGKWTRVASADRQVTAHYPVTPSRVYVATTRGRLRRFDGQRETVIKNPMATDDRVVQLVGRPGEAVYGRSSSGMVLVLGATEATPLTFDGELAGFQVQLLGVGPKKAVLATGAVPGPSGGPPSVVLVELGPTGAKRIATLDPLAPGDRITVIHTAADGRLVLASFAGSVRIRTAEGTWETAQISGEVPRPVVGAAPGRGPARSR